MRYRLAVLVLSCAVSLAVGYKAHPHQPVTAELGPFYRLMRLSQTWLEPQIPSGAVIFLGDSITQGLLVESVASPAVNLGIGGDTTVGVMARLPDHPSLWTARAIVLAIGVNDLALRSNEEIAAGIGSILYALPVPVIVSAVLPIGIDGFERVAPLNERIVSTVARYPNAVFVDVHGLSDTDGRLRPEMSAGDGVHLSLTGYQCWTAALRAALTGLAPTARAGRAAQPQSVSTPGLASVTVRTPAARCPR
jgi:lysophospholipase L1-like esterase